MYQSQDSIGPYILLEKLGRGAFGVVWLASKRTALSEHRVALKLPLADEVNLDAIRQEASVWEAAKGHPNIVPIIEAELYENQVVIASEYVPDGTLADWLQRNGGAAPDADTAISLTQGILAGLAHLHERRIIHRDLKPANILLQAQTPRLADFGLARCLKSTNSSSTVSGTFAYMPPEAFEGKRMPQSDLWAVGVMLYQMLAGRVPFLQTESPALWAAIITKEPDALPDSVPPALRQVIACALRKDPLERYPDATLMSDALRTAQQAHPSFGAYRPAPAPTWVMPSASAAATAATLVQSGTTAISTPAFSAVSPVRRVSRIALVTLAVASLLVTAGVTFSRRWTWLARDANPTVTAPAQRQHATISRRPAGSAPPLDGTTPHREALPGGVILEMRPVAPGRFMMGAPHEEGHSEREGPPHAVTFKRAFYLGRYEITQRQWQAVMGENPARFTGDAQRPVENVSWIDAQEFCRRLSDATGRVYRLPSEAEWEYAARANHSGPYAGDLDALAWYDANAGGTAQPVGQKTANDFGFSDMHGNVSEWCEDVWHDNYQNAPSEGRPWLMGGDASIRVARGGAWGNGARLLRSAYRSDSFGADVRSNLVGLRVATDAR